MRLRVDAGPMKLRYLLLVIVMAMAAGCAKDAAPIHQKQEQAEQLKAELTTTMKVFGIIYPMAHPSYEHITEIAAEHAARHQVKLVVKAPDTASIEQQIRMMETMIKDQVDGIAVSPIDSSALTPIINKAMAAGIPVICFESDAPGSDRLAFVGADHYLTGQQIAISLSRLLQGKGMILVESGMSSMYSMSKRLEGLLDYLYEKSEIEVLEVRYHEGNEEKAMADIESMIDRHPHFDAIVGLDFISAAAATLIWKAKGLNRHAIYLGLTPVVKEAMLNGHLTSIISQNEELWGELLVETLIRSDNIDAFVDTGIVELLPN